VSVIVDTPVWSLAFRYPKQSGSESVLREFSRLIQEHRADILGPIRQEILSGIKHVTQFRTLRAYLRAFVDLPIEMGDFEYAAELYNQCRARGVQGSHTDFLICAVSIRASAPIFTTDRDFVRFAKHIDISLHQPRNNRENLT
jgi:hypothetical protein